ncbi:MRP-L47-domain-containing protein [Hypoxylon trugodes]|uniref:MRP-L47-domain-containing protein n=1 Tax=Hypoxylon trugodes TaxID=326681 RepID=UPI00219B0209|nr:MRP-L47-domain-containing protein [Hypoxylon trugodes]KAI1386191.1 MRP-L47-domain-containing protein [Hypoxylon trugodes]
MAMASSIRPSIGRIINSAGPHHPSPLLAILSTTTKTTTAQRCPFSSTPNLSIRKPRRDNNRLRGVSSIYRSGPRARTNISKDEIPQPADYTPEVETDPNHGLWQFFYAPDRLVPTPEKAEEYGRAWTVEELRHKSWDDLHRLWWVCVKEKNRIATALKESKRLKLLSGDDEIKARLQEVRKTMKAIKHTLTERYYLWEDARELAATDPEINLSNTKTPYNPSKYFDEIEPTEEAASAEGSQEGGDKSTAEKVDPSTIPANATETQQPSTRV